MRLVVNRNVSSYWKNIDEKTEINSEKCDPPLIRSQRAELADRGDMPYGQLVPAALLVPPRKRAYATAARLVRSWVG